MMSKDVRNDEAYSKYNAISRGYKRNIRVKDISSAKKLMQRIFMQLQDGKISANEAKASISCCRDFIGAIKDAELENQIKELKEMITKIKGK